MRPLSLLIVDWRLNFDWLLRRRLVVLDWRLLISVARSLGWSEVAWREGLQVQDLVLVLIERSCD